MGDHTQHSYLREACELQYPPGWRTPGICEVEAHRGMSDLPPVFLGLDWLLFRIKEGPNTPGMTCQETRKEQRPQTAKPGRGQPQAGEPQVWMHSLWRCGQSAGPGGTVLCPKGKVEEAFSLEVTGVTQFILLFLLWLPGNLGIRFSY